jgi:hypothetical protein
MKNLKFILFLQCIFSFSQSTELYIPHDEVVTGIETSNISFSFSRKNISNEIFVKDNTIFYNYKSSIYSYELINIITNENYYNNKNAHTQTTIKKQLAALADKKTDNHVFKSLPCNAPFSIFSKNRSFSAVISNVYQYKNNEKDLLLFSTFTNSLFAIHNKSNRLTVAYNNTAKSYLLVYNYTSRPPPVVV